MAETITVRVPPALQRLAVSALEVHRANPLPDEVSGITLAERLARGSVSAEDVAALWRFFAVNARAYAHGLTEFRSARVDALARSWALRAGDRGRAWAEREFHRLVREGVVPADPYALLLRSEPEEVYARFAASAWRWEYGLDSPTKAAKFYEEYHRATGFVLDLHQAFGPSGRAVANAIYRRTYGEDPFVAAKRALQVEDAEYRLAATVDLNELRTSFALAESLKPFVFQSPDNFSAKMLWPGFVAYVVLAAEDPKRVANLNVETKRPPMLDQEPLKGGAYFSHYSDAVRTYITYFHPSGSKYVSPAGTDFAGIDERVADLMLRAWLGKKIVPTQARKVLGEARRWTAQNKLAGSLFHVYNADWAKGNWQHILDAIPLDHDVREPFAAFVKVGTKPSEGVKLQQTLSDKKQLAAIATMFAITDPKDLVQVKLSDTEFGKTATELSTPVGIYSTLRQKGKSGEWVVLGAFKTEGNTQLVLATPAGKLTEYWLPAMTQSLKDGEWEVAKAHKDMQIVYGEKPSAETMAKSGDDPAVKPDANPNTNVVDPVTLPSAPLVPAPKPEPSGPETLTLPNVQPTDVAGLGMPKDPFGYVVGEVFKHLTTFFWVREVGPDAYVVLRLTIAAHLGKTSPSNVKKGVESVSTSQGVFTDPASLWPFVQVSTQGPPFEPSPGFGSIHSGSILNNDDVVATLVSGGKPFAVTFTDGGLKLQHVAVPVMQPSYAPTEPKPQGNLVDTAALSGTQEAFNFLTNKGWKPATAKDGNFKLKLGHVYGYKSGKNRTVLGYGLDEGGPIYVIRTEKGNVNWKSVAGGNKDYTPLLGPHPPTIGLLLPLPGAKPQPKLNYLLSNKAKKVVAAKEWTLANAPKTSPFLVGVPLMFPTGVKTRILAWIPQPQYPEGDPLAVMDLGGADAFSVITMEELKKLSGYYETDTQISVGGDVVFGKKPNDEKVTLQDFFIAKSKIVLPSPLPEGWDNPAPVPEPEMLQAPAGKHVSAGILTMFTASTHVSTKTGGTLIREFASLVLCKPAGGYGGYSLTIPKGTVGKGESPVGAATREFQEETGMSVRPVAFLGDFTANQSVVRLYVGVVTGGDPQAKQMPGKDEVDAVVLKPLEGLANLSALTWWSQLVPESGSTWQQEAVQAFVQWLEANGLPHSYAAPDAPTTKSQVTFKGEGSKLAAKSSSAPTGGDLIVSDDETDVWKSLLFKAPFPVTTAMVVALKSQVKSGYASEPTGFNAARTRVIGPKFGQMFETSFGTPYTAAGYVSWKGLDGIHYHYLLGLTGAGLVEPFVVQAEGAPHLKVSETDTEASKAASTSPWFSHPDPAVMARIKLIYQNKGELSAAKVNMQTFKLAWLKQAGVPYYAVASTNLLEELSGLFVAGALTEAQKNAVLGALKARMTATQSGKKEKLKNGPVTAGHHGVAPTSPPIPAPPKPSVVLDKPLIPETALSTVQYPEAVALKPADVSTLTTSTKPTQIVEDNYGNRFFLKWRNDAPFQAETDKAAAVLMAAVKKNVVPVNVFTHDGKKKSIQPFFVDAQPVPNAPNDLSDANKAELLAQHAFDMFVGDHDGHGGNWIQVGSKMIAVDRGQAFKFIFQGKTESLDPNWHAPGNFGDGYAKRLLREWAAGTSVIPASAWAAMHGTILNVQNRFTHAVLESALTPVFDDMELKPAQRGTVLDKLDKRRDSYLDDWTKVLKGLRKDFAWKGVSGGLVVDIEVLKSSPKDLKFGKKEETVIEEAVAAGWQGKSLRVDGPSIENQEVMCRSVLWEETPGVTVPATLIHFRLTKNAGVKASASIMATGVLETVDSPGGPQRLMVDKANSLYEKLFAAIKTINFHLNKGTPAPDGKPNQVTVQAAIDLRPFLQKLLTETKSDKGTYAPTKEPNHAVSAMADQYLGYVSAVEYWNTNALTLIGKHSPIFTEFVYEEPPETAKPKPKKSFQAKLKNQGASYPTISNSGAQIIVRNLHKPVVNSSQVSQFVIEDPASGGKLFVNPTSEAGGVKAGVQGVKGLCWGIIPGAPSTATVAHLLKLFGEATGISMAASSEKDQQVLYLAKQVGVMQSNGSFKPTADGTAVVDPDLVKATSSYENGDTETAISILTKRTAALSGLSSAAVAQAAAEHAAGVHDARGAGFYRHHRLGWDVSRLKSVLGDKTFVAHALLGHTSVIAFLNDVSINGALLANEVKPFYGVVKEGASPSSDFSQGGSQGVFCCFRKGNPHVKHLYFDLSLALRVDLYIVGSGDSFGNVHAQRYTMPEQWTQAVGSGYISGGSSWQVLVRHDIDLREYLVRAHCASASEAQQCIDLVTKLGWTFKHGAASKIFTS